MFNQAAPSLPEVETMPDWVVAPDPDEVQEWVVAPEEPEEEDDTLEKILRRCGCGS